MDTMFKPLTIETSATIADAYRARRTDGTLGPASSTPDGARRLAANEDELQREVDDYVARFETRPWRITTYEDLPAEFGHRIALLTHKHRLTEDLHERNTKTTNPSGLTTARPGRCHTPGLP